MKIPTILLCACFATACTIQPNKTASPVNKSTASVKIVASKSIDAIEFLNFAESFSNLPIDSQKQALTETNQVLVLNPNDLLHRMKLAMIYGLPSSMIADTIKAQQLLQKIMQEDILVNSQLAFANLLFDHLSLVNKFGKNHNSEPKRLESLQQKNDNLQQKLDATLQKLEISQQKLDAAQLKLDELKKIEKSMGERDTSPKR